MTEKRITHEVVQPPPFNIIRMTQAQAFQHCKDVKAKRDEMLTKGYGVSSPDIFKSYFKSQIPDNEFEKLFNQWFDNWNVDEQVKQLKACEPTFQAGVALYLPLQKWGFFIPDEYNVVVTPCAIGAGGGYDLESIYGPRITMYYGRAWTPEGRTPEGCLLHEAFHLGIEDFIKELEIDQKNKERIVDFCTQEILVPQVLPHIPIQYKDVSPINAYLAMTNLSVLDRLRKYHSEKQ